MTITHKMRLLPLAVIGIFAGVSAQADTWSSIPDATKGASKAPSAAQAVAVSPASATGGYANQLLFSEIELLKQEIQKLQSKVEEQSYELNKLKNEQKERYLDLDRRVGQLLSSGVKASVVDTDVQGKPVYGAAFELMKNRKLDEAVTAFKQFLQQYPQSSLVVNGYYWLGQIYYKQANLDEARKAFLIVKNQFPDHAKAADSRYKLGVVLHRLGDDVQAKSILQAVVKQYGDSASARFSSKYLKENFPSVR